MTEEAREDKIIDFSEFQNVPEEKTIIKKVQDIIKMHKFIAQSKRSMYLCFIEAGFTKAEALELIKDK